jgi:hypothetical protein
MADQDPTNIPDFDGGNAVSTGQNFLGGSSTYASTPQGASGSEFKMVYTNVAKVRSDLERVNKTFKEFNDPYELKFVGTSFTINKKAVTSDSLDISDFFHPLLDFSEYQKQTFVIGTGTTINIDPSSFYMTLGVVSFVICKAEYLPESSPDDRVLFWDYLGNTRNIMGEIMILSGAVKENVSWYGWDLNPYSTVGQTGPVNVSQGGLSFTNPTGYSVRLTIITAN